MSNHPRRTLLGSIGATVALGTAGCLSLGPERESEDGEREDRIEDVLDALPASIDGADQLAAYDVEAFEDLHDPAGAVTASVGVPAAPEDEQQPSTMAVVFASDGTDFEFTTVATGDIDPDAEDGWSRRAERDEYDLYEIDEGGEGASVAAIQDDFVVVADGEDRVEEALAARDGDADRLVDHDDAFSAALREIGEPDSLTITKPDGAFDLDDAVDPESVRYQAMASTVLDSETVEVRTVVETVDEAAVTDDLVDAVGSGDLVHGIGGRDGESTVGVDGRVVSATFEVDVIAVGEEESHESPRIWGSADVDLTADYVEIEVKDGEPTPVEELTLEVNGEAYDPAIWTDGATEIAEGDVLLVETDVVEPNTRVELRHVQTHTTSSSATTVLGYLRFDFEYDEDAGTVTVEYADDIDLDGDDIFLAVDESRRTPFDAAPDRSTQPWTGVTLSGGEDVTVSATYGNEVLVGWEGDTRDHSIASYYVHPPGTVSFDYDWEAETLDVTLEVERARPADAYEIVIGEDFEPDEPADVQFTDEFDRIDPVASVTVRGVENGTRAGVRWTENDETVASTRVAPSVDLTLSPDEGIVEHHGGAALPADEVHLSVAIETEEEGDDPGHRTFETEEIDVGDEIDGEFAEGDSVDLPENVSSVDLYYEDVPIAHAFVPHDTGRDSVDHD